MLSGDLYINDILRIPWHQMQDLIKLHEAMDRCLPKWVKGLKKNRSMAMAVTLLNSTPKTAVGKKKMPRRAPQPLHVDPALAKTFADLLELQQGHIVITAHDEPVYVSLIMVSLRNCVSNCMYQPLITGLGRCWRGQTHCRA
jgi:hypothetical protein